VSNPGELVPSAGGHYCYKVNSSLLKLKGNAAAMPIIY